MNFWQWKAALSEAEVSFAPILLGASLSLTGLIQTWGSVAISHLQGSGFKSELRLLSM